MPIRPHAQQLYGLDYQRYRENIRQFNEIKMSDGTYYIPLKSVATGTSDKVRIVLPKGKKTAKPLADGNELVTFQTENNETLSPTDTVTAGDSTVATLLIPAGTKKVKAFVTRTIKEKETEVLIGLLEIKDYTPQTRNVILVSVNKAKLSIDNAALQTALNGIYAQSVSNWVVSDTNSLSIAGMNTIDDGDNALCSKYTGNMQTIIQAFKDSLGDLPNDNTVCLFLCDTAKSKTKQGYMPLKGRFGFLFTSQLTDAATTKRTAAHELAHGTFRLWHTFSTENKYIFAERTTNNLMDYNAGSELYKYQWDYVHNPETMYFAWTQDEAEGAADLMPCSSRIAKNILKYQYVLNENLNEQWFTSNNSEQNIGEPNSIINLESYWMYKDKMYSFENIVFKINGEIIDQNTKCNEFISEILKTSTGKPYLYAKFLKIGTYQIDIIGQSGTCKLSSQCSVIVKYRAPAIQYYIQDVNSKKILNAETDPASFNEGENYVLQIVIKNADGTFTPIEDKVNWDITATDVNANFAPISLNDNKIAFKLSTFGNFNISGSFPISGSQDRTENQNINVIDNPELFMCNDQMENIYLAEDGTVLFREKGGNQTYVLKNQRSADYI